MLQEHPVCAMADPAIVSTSKLPYIDFVDIGLRENKDDVPPKVETEEGMVGKMLKLSRIDLQKYYHTVAWTKRLHRRPIPKSEAYTNPNENHKSILTEIMTKVKATPMYLKETDIADNFYELRKTKKEQDVLEEDPEAEASESMSDTNQSWINNVDDQEEMIERAIWDLQKKQSLNAAQNQKDRKNIKVARRFGTKYPTVLGEDGSKRPKKRALKALHLRHATPAELSRLVVEAYETSTPKIITENRFKVDEAYYIRFKEAYLKVKKRLEVEMIKDNKRNEMMLGPAYNITAINLQRNENKAKSHGLI